MWACVALYFKSIESSIRCDGFTNASCFVSTATFESSSNAGKPCLRKEALHARWFNGAISLQNKSECMLKHERKISVKRHYLKLFMAIDYLLQIIQKR